MKKQYHTLIPASYLVLVRGSEVFLSRRKNTGFYDGSYSFPAGHVERGETFTQALVREVQEEIGVSIDFHSAEVKHIMHRKSEDGQERIDTFFTVKQWEGEIKNKEPEKCDDLGWFALQALPENTIPYIRQVLKNIQKGIFYSEFGW